MISIKSYLERFVNRDSATAAPHDDLTAALRQALRIVLAALPLEIAPNCEGGRAAMDELLARLDTVETPFEILEIADSAAAAVEENTGIVRKRHHAHSEELQAMISMLAETVASISVQKDNSIAQLKEIERRIEHASLVEDMRALKSNLADCLAAVREAARQQQAQSSNSIERLETQIRSSKTHLTAQSATPASESDAFLDDDSEPPREAAYAAVFLLDRADLISRRYGESVRNEVVAFVRKHFKKMLMPTDRFIRWNGAAFVVLLQRHGSSEDVTAELRSVASLARSQYFDIGDRSVLLDTSLTWTVFPQADFASPDLLFKGVDEFIKRAVAARQPVDAKIKPHQWPVRLPVAD